MGKNKWGWIVARGVLAVVFGLLAVFLPKVTWAVLMAIFAAYALIDGVASLAAAFSRRAPGERPWWMLLIQGVAGLAVAAFTLISPLRTSVVFLYILGAWAVVTGAAEIATAVRLRRVLVGEWRLALAGALSIVFGLAVWVWPAAAMLALMWWVGAWAFAFGALMIFLGMRMRQWHDDDTWHQDTTTGGGGRALGTRDAGLGQTA